MIRRKQVSTKPIGSALAGTLVCLSLSLTATPALAEADDDTAEIEVFDARSCPEIFGDDGVVAANKARREGRFHGVSRGPNDVTVTHQVAWWSGPKKLRIPAAMVVDVEEASAPIKPAAEVEATSNNDDSKPASDAAKKKGTKESAKASKEAEAKTATVPSLVEAEAQAASDGAGLVMVHGSVNASTSPRTSAAANTSSAMKIAHIELGEMFKEQCDPGLYEVGVDDALGQNARIYAVLDEGVLIENGDSLGFLVVDDGPVVPAIRMIWRSAYAIEFEEGASRSKVKSKSKKKKKKKKKKKRSKRNRKKRKR